MLDSSLVFAAIAVALAAMSTLMAYVHRVDTSAMDREMLAREAFVARYEVSAREADLLLQAAQEDLRRITSVTPMSLPVVVSLPPDEAPPPSASVALTYVTSCARCSEPLTTYDLFCDNCGWKVTGPRDPRP
jgi:hypothetical protein